VILEIELQGALIVREKYPDAMLVFITAKDADTLETRLRSRGTEDEATIRKRLTRAIGEADGVEHYDHIITNDQLEETIELLHKVLQSDSGYEPTEADYTIIRNIQSELKNRLSI
jgi:guanylate kinase